MKIKPHQTRFHEIFIDLNNPFIGLVRLTGILSIVSFTIISRQADCTSPLPLRFEHVHMSASHLIESSPDFLDWFLQNNKLVVILRPDGGEHNLSVVEDEAVLFCFD